MLPTWDVRRPIEVDPVTLRFLGGIGRIDSWGGPSIPMGEISSVFTEELERGG